MHTSNFILNLFIEQYLFIYGRIIIIIVNRDEIPYPDPPYWKFRYYHDWEKSDKILRRTILKLTLLVEEPVAEWFRTWTLYSIGSPSFLLKMSKQVPHTYYWSMRNEQSKVKKELGLINKKKKKSMTQTLIISITLNY